MTTHKLSYNSNIETVNAIQFGMKSPEQIEKEAVVEIFTYEMFDGDIPVRGGLFDPHMGVLEDRILCPTDKKDNIECPGYPGFIRLAYPVYNFSAQKTVIRALKLICINCYKLYIDIDEPAVANKLKKIQKSKRFIYITELTNKEKVKVCRNCGASRPSNIKTNYEESLTNIYIESKTSSNKISQLILSVKDILFKLKHISQKDAEAMGFSSLWCLPHWLIYQNLPVIPPAARPSVKTGDGTLSQDDLTSKYYDILKTNRALSQKLENPNTPEHIVQGLINALQYHVATLVNNENNKIPTSQQRSGRPIKSIIQRIKGKEGIVRGNLMGKRVEFSARSVITPDPNIEIDQLGVPLKIAVTLTKPIIVDKWNIKELTKYIHNGPDKWPGANKYMPHRQKMKKNLKGMDYKSIKLEYGDVVFRHIVDEDIVLFNRQPSLHRMSMQGHRVKVMKCNTFRLNLTVTAPYNADFDGDEMNMHVGQSFQADVEIRVLAAVPYQIIGPGQNRPVVGLVQDTLIGSNLMTSYKTFLTINEIKSLLIWIREYKDEFAHIDGIWNTSPYFPKGTPLHGQGGVLEVCPEFPLMHEAVEHKEDGGSYLREDLWTGRQLVNLIIPSMYLSKSNMAYDDLPESRKHEGKVIIENGEYKGGVLDKNIIGAKSQGLIHVIFNDLGPAKAKDFLDDMQNLVTNWMVTHGFSVGIGDLIANSYAKKSMNNILEDKKKKVIELIQDVHRGILKNDTGKPDSEEFELQVNRILNEAISKAGKLGIRELPSTNRMIALVKCGSKGSDLNVGQMIACVGQQNVDGRRIQDGFDGRTLPHYHKYDDGPESRGFVSNSFVAGVEPDENYHHARGGREGLIDTAVKTSSSGYVQRKIVKGLEEVNINADNTVRDGNGNIIQFIYGEDGMESTKIEKQHLNIICMDYKEITAKYRFGITEPFEEYCTDEIVEQITEKVVTSRKAVLKIDVRLRLEEHFNQLLEDKQFIIDDVQKNNISTEIYSVINMDRLIKNIKNKYAHNNVKSNLHPVEILEQLEEFKRTLYITKMNRGNHMFNILLRQKLSPKIIIKQHRFTKEAFYELVQLIHSKFQEAIAEIGQAVGVIAAQSIGEPTTQLTLNSVTYDTEILVRDQDKNIERVQIGEFTERWINENKKRKIKGYEYMEDKDMTYAPLDKYYEVPSVTERGVMCWKRIEAATQHPVVNEDGTNTMLKVTTEQNREVTATKAKSFLQLRDGRIQGVNGEDLKVGDYLPVSMMPITYNEKNILDLKKILLPNEYLYVSEMEKAKTVMDEYHWWMKYHNKLFTLPYKRSDSFRVRVNGKLHKGCKNQQEFTSGCVYPKKTGLCISCIPEEIPLDYNFGYLIGAYCAEGCVTRTQISIANNENSYLEPIKEWCDKYNITTKMYRHENKNQKGWTSQDIRIYSILLRDLLFELCGKLSHGKRLHDKLIFSNKEFHKGFLDAYIGGDGTISKKYNNFIIGSVSKQMLIDFQQILNIKGIYSHIRKPTKITKNNRGTLSENIKQFYTLIIRNNQANKLAELLNIRIKIKQQRVVNINNLTRKRLDVDKQYKQMPHIKDNKLVFENRNNQMPKTYFDKVKSIEEIKNPIGNYAYDLTVEDTRNFNIYNSLSLRDTFHFSGIGSKSNVVRGVPRITEILDATKESKAPALTIYVKPEVAEDKEKTRKVLNFLEISTIKNIITKLDIYWDPLNNVNESQDSALLDIYKEFHEFADYDQKELNPWILRLQFNRPEMLERNLKMEDIYYVIDRYFNKIEQKIHCTYSDDNSSNLITRVQLLEKNIQDDMDIDDITKILTKMGKQIMDLTLKGIKGIKKASMYKEENVYRKINGRYIKTPEWVIDTDGSNLIEVLALDEVDSTKTYTNDLHEMYEVFGIEAVRELIIREVNEVMSFSGSYINYRHVSLLADMMTNKGNIMPITRHGINKSNRGPLAKASFEETPDVLIRAAIFGEIDNMKGPSSNIMFGQEIKMGTGAVDLLYDENALYQEEEVEHDVVKGIDDEEFFKNYCTTDKLDFNMPQLETEQTRELEDGIVLPSVGFDSDSEDSD